MIQKSTLCQYTLRNSDGMVVKVLNFGGTLTDILPPDRMGRLENVVLGLDAIESYQRENNPYLGSTIGRYANRIANASFKLNGEVVMLNANNNRNTLHGGPQGFHRVWWDIDVLSEDTLIMRYTSPDGEQGFPGNLKIEVKVSVGADYSVTLEYVATTDKPTPVNLTNHSYFNLSGARSETILDHELVINADRITVADDYLIPTGTLQLCAGTPFDFSLPKRIGKDIGSVPVGYDHNYVLRNADGELTCAAILYDPASGRQLELYTTVPGLQFYSGHYFDGSMQGRGNQQLKKYAGLCLEPQHFPDSPNQPSFPNTIINPGDAYRQTSIYKFSVR